MTTGIGTLSDLLPQPGTTDRIYGVVVGLVTDIDVDAAGQSKGVHQNLYRVQVKFPWLDATFGLWARVATPMAGPGRGLYLPLQLNDEVAVMFEHGDPNHPIVIGALWNGDDKPPAAVPPTKDKFRYVLRSMSGHTITLDDSRGSEMVSIVDKTGKNQLVFDSSKNTVTISSEQDVTITAKGNLSLSAPQGDVTVKCNNFSVTAQQGYSLAANTKGELKATAELDLTCMAGVKINTDGLVVT